MEKATINGIVNSHVRENLSPKQVERDMVSREYELLCGFVGGACFQSGSYARYTSTTPVNDLDVIWRLPDSFLSADTLKKVAAGINPSDFDSSSVLSKLAEHLRVAYEDEGRDVRIKEQSHSVGIYFGDEDDFSIDLVPAIAAGRKNEYGDDIYWVPEIAELSKSRRARAYTSGGPIDWLLSDPRGYIEDARELNSSNESFRKAAKFIRRWRRGCKATNPDFSIKSFHTELILNEIFKSSPGITTIDAIAQFFSELGGYFDAPRFPDRADPSRFVDSYVGKLGSEEKEEVMVRAHSTSVMMEELISAQSEDEVRKAMNQVLKGGVGAAKSYAGRTASTVIPTAYTAPSSFHPQRSYGDSDIRGC